MKLKGISGGGFKRLAQYESGGTDPISQALTLLEGIDLGLSSMDEDEIRQHLHSAMELLTQSSR